MIDIHSHIINEIDDGSKSIEMTITMLKKAEISGTKSIVATPHFMRGRFDVEYSEVLKRVEELKKEYFNDKCIGTINGSRYMLIELPMLEFNLDEVIDTIYELQIRKIVPIIAHPERYKQFIKKPSMINALIKEGMLFQLNAGSIAGNFGKDVKKTAQRFLEHNVYSFIGSDAHRDRGRDTDMSEALKLLEKSQKRAFISNASAMLDDEEVAFNGTAVKEKKFLGLF